MPKALHYNYLHRTPYRLVTLTGKGGEKYSLYLGIIPKLNKEGEITLMLANEQQQTLALLTFSLFYYQQQKHYLLAAYRGLIIKHLTMKFRPVLKRAMVYSQNVWR